MAGTPEAHRTVHPQDTAAGERPVPVPVRKERKIMASYTDDEITRAMNTLDWQPGNWTALKGTLVYHHNNPPKVNQGHVQKEKEVTSYTEEEIRKAFTLQGNIIHYSLGELLIALAKLKDDHVHDFADSDTITVKELRDAELRLRDTGTTLTMPFTAGKLLQDISEHREPDYPYATVWKDYNGTYWFRTSRNAWLRFGIAPEQPHDLPRRPLRRMDVTP